MVSFPYKRLVFLFLLLSRPTHKRNLRMDNPLTALVSLLYEELLQLSSFLPYYRRLHIIYKRPWVFQRESVCP